MSDSLQPHGLYSPWNSPGQNTGVGSLSLLQGIFLIQGSNPGLPQCRWIIHHLSRFSSVQVRSVTQSCPTLCDPMNRSPSGLPVHHQLLEFTQTCIHQVNDAIQPSIFCHPLLLLPLIPPSIRVFSSESALLMRWPKYWSFSFSIIPSKEIPGLISFRMD